MIRIDLLPDDVLLEAFDFCITIIDPLNSYKKWIEAWQLLVPVCRRWRNLVFGSPRCLKLRLVCTPGTPAKASLGVCPALPLIVKASLYSSPASPSTGNVVAALRQSNRVREVNLSYLAVFQFDKVLALMQVSFTKLTDLELFSCDDETPIIPDSFLDGSAPCL